MKKLTKSERRERRSAINRRYKLQKRYGLTLADYQRLWDEQNGKCAICQQREIKIHGETKLVVCLSVDHSHETGQVRGLLCHNCNTFLGKCEDANRLQAAIQYLNLHKMRGTIHVLKEAVC